MIASTDVGGKNIGESLFKIPQTTVEDATEYIAVPMGYFPTVTVIPGDGATAAVYYTTSQTAALASVAEGDWTAIAAGELPTFGFDIQISGLKLVATGAVVIRGFMV